MNIELLEIGSPAPVTPKPRSEVEIMGTWTGDKSKPVVSIVCHTFNHVNFLKDALNGFLMQETNFPFEIILHDDASTDGTTEIVKEYSEKYPSIITPIIQTENQWSKGNTPRVFTFPNVNGKYIALCEGDDYWISPKKLQTQIDSFSPSVSLVFHDAIRIENSLITALSYYTGGKTPINGYTPFQMARGSKTPTASSVFISSPFRGVDQISVVNGDHLLWAILASAGSAKFLQEKWSAYRHHAGGVWSARELADKVQPALKSKRTIFQVASPALKTAALVGYCAMSIELLSDTLKNGNTQSALAMIRTTVVDFYKMTLKCKFHSGRNIIDYATAFGILTLKIPILFIKHSIRT